MRRQGIPVTMHVGSRSGHSPCVSRGTTTWRGRRAPTNIKSSSAASSSRDPVRRCARAPLSRLGGTDARYPLGHNRQPHEPRHPPTHAARGTSRRARERASGGAKWRRSRAWGVLPCVNWGAVGCSRSWRHPLHPAGDRAASQAVVTAANGVPSSWSHNATNAVPRKNSTCCRRLWALEGLGPTGPGMGYDLFTYWSMDSGE